ncbi:hypothetical protein F4803DRAFT_413481 [Xylaria telfairii]|nr:hypothetical protein F4803DRAFT_413481 [Xylaria telfairii]
MELGDSFIAAIFGGWIPVPVRELSRLRDDFSFADGVAWRQALNWDHHRMRPKYRAHYSIPIDYIARLFTEANWSTTPEGATALIRPQALAGDSIALRIVGLYTPLTRAGQHATAAIADFHCNGDGCVWNRRPGAWFRIPQYDGWMHPEIELPTAQEDASYEPRAKGHGRRATTRHQGGKQEGGGDALSLPLASLPQISTAVGATTTTKLSTRKTEYSPRKLALVRPTTKIPRPISGGSPVPRCSVGAKNLRKRSKAEALPLADSRADKGPSQIEQKTQESLPTQIREQRRHREHQDVAHTGEPQSILTRIRHREDGNTPCARIGGCREDDNNNNVGSHDRGEISVDELKKRLSQLIGVSLTELERLFDGPSCKSAVVE